ncbi:hypothetical protein [Alloprevotella tannerae]|jgi:putative endoribonuclease|uniref:hypothetical protein n=1 Tax=Alloprevotella tannerae TaxID=76122 RepID=UPI00241F5BAB|nr:hypothetical protein [Alloprevotella tannerae]
MFLVMVDYKNIENTLKQLDSMYLKYTGDPSFLIILSKTALIEFCGWVEQSIDQILNEYVQSHMKEQNMINYTNSQIKKNYGFKYENNILKILCITIGAYNLENVLRKINSAQLKALLNTYSDKRNRAAHTHILGTTAKYDAPSLILNDFHQIKPIISTIENEIRSLP